MANVGSSSAGVQVTAVIMGAFLSGTMMGLSLIGIPLLLNTNVRCEHLLRQWVCLYNYGHRILPAISITTLLIYAYIVFNKWSDGESWISYALAGALTVGIIPFTLIVMLSTNNLLFQLEDEIKTNSKATTLENAQKLVTKWGRMHLMRSCFPLAGAFLGCYALLAETNTQ
ncbi:hypothetical protein LTR37_003760 [Vermiconidia calcicola]|uniref:Uncharacterized protein n=1 Tax=Vermiconidia calcicola TaxID=1690605 RepID=A0ACC3NQD5_9PEZI|nr:hypothetical protein LTR37_003760 [Vermiconidia calcicola]